MIISQLQQVSKDWNGAWDFRQSFYVRDVGGRGQLDSRVSKKGEKYYSSGKGGKGGDLITLYTRYAIMATTKYAT